MAARAGRPPELAEILKIHAPPLDRLEAQRREVVRDIVSCRSALLGGHLQVCDQCGHRRPLYNSCRNRHCPKCQGLQQARWVEAQAARLLPVPYFHLVFTVPPCLHPLFFHDRRVAYSLLFAAAMEALQDVSQRRLGARVGVIAVLHTWTQTLVFHPHIHAIVSGGGLSHDHQRWIASRPNFLVPVRALSRVFRGKLLYLFEQALASTCFHGMRSLGPQLLRQALAKEWVVYCKPPMAGPEQVLRYLGRYTHRIAIGNERLVSLAEGGVVFRYRDRRHHNRRAILALPGEEFVRRFLLHVLPKRFVRVRHYGFIANAQCAALIRRARSLLGTVVPAEPLGSQDTSWQDLYRRLTGRDPDLCPQCGRGILQTIAVLPPLILTQLRGP